MRAVTISLPWAPRLLWPNGRPRHWSDKAKAVRRQRHDAAGLALEAGLRKAPDGTSVRLTWAFQPPFRTTAFDIDNAIASQKGAVDGIAAVLGLNDRTFTYAEPVALPRDRSKQGAAILTITLSEPAGG